MKLRIVSDLHFEFHPDGGRQCARSVCGEPFDVLIVAGDLASSSRLADALELVAEATRRPIVYVLGNHEPYGASIVAARRIAADAAARFPHLHVLERDVLTLDGQRFVGCSLWFDHDGAPVPTDFALNDFRAIADLRDEIAALSKSSREFLAAEVRRGDVVVTHHLPHARSILPVFEGDPLNRYFLHDLSEVVERGGATLWIHGHTHGSLDYVVGDTRVVCNPLGYVRHAAGEPNPEFDRGLTIEV